MRLRAGALLLIASLLGVVYPSVLFAAHTLDTSARFPNDATTTNNGNPVSTTYTCGSGTTVFVLGVTTLSGTNRAGGAPTYNGLTMTQANSTQKSASSPEASAEVWYLLAPPTGSSYTVSVPNTNTAGIKLQMASFKASSGNGSTLDTSNGCSNTSTNPTCSVTTGANGDAIFGVIASGANAYSGATQNQTSLWVMDLGTQGTSSQYALQSTLGTIAFSNTFGTSDDWGEVVVAFKELSYTVNLTGVQASGLKAPCTGGPGECVYVGGGATLSLDTKLATASKGTIDVEPKVAALQTQLATSAIGTLTNVVDGFMLPSVSATASRGTLGVLVMPKDVFYSVSLAGTAVDKKTGSPTITITDGVGVFSEPQVGDIGQGMKVTYDTTSICYISRVNSLTSFNMIENDGDPCPDTSGAKTVNSMKYVFSSLTDAKNNWGASGYLGTWFVGPSYANINLNFVVYNNPGGTQQESVTSLNLMANVSSWSDRLNRFSVYQPKGPPESVNDQAHFGIWDTANFYSLLSTGRWWHDKRGDIRNMQFTSSSITNGDTIVSLTDNGLDANESASRPSVIEGNIFRYTGNKANTAIYIGSSSGGYSNTRIRNNLVYSTSTRYGKAVDFLPSDTGAGDVVLVSNNTFSYIDYGVDGDPDSTVTVKNNIFNDLSGTVYCIQASGTNNAYSGVSGSYNCGGTETFSNTFSFQSSTYLLSSSDTGAKNKGTDNPEGDITRSFSTDFKGQTRPNGNWDIGWHEYLDPSVAPTYALATVYTGNISVDDGGGSETINLTTNLATASRGDLTVTKDDGEFVNLTTATATAYAGDLGVVGQRDASVDLTTVAGTGERGTLSVSADASLSLTTVAGTGERGDLTVTAGADATLVTKLATGQRGDITVQSGADVPLTTVAGTGQRGDLNVTVDQTVPLTTVLATGERGTLDVSAGADVALTTVAGTGQHGDINPNVGTYILLDTVAGTAQITSPTFSSSGDVTLATKLATGQRGTLTVTVDQTVPLTTVAGTGERGTLDVSGGANVALTTVNGTGQRGDLAVSGGASVDLTTVAGTGQRGDITATGESTADVNLTTVAGTGQRGTLTVTSGAQVDLTTVAGTSARGTLDVSAGATVALSTVLGTGQRGDLTVDWLVPSQNVDLTTQVATSSYGIISVYGGSSVALTGETATGQRGDLTTEGTSGATVALTTVAGTGERGTITPSWYRDGNALLAGTEAPSLTGDIAPSGDAAIGLTGEVVVAYANDIVVRRSSFRPWWPMPGGVVGTGGLVR